AGVRQRVAGDRGPTPRDVGHASGETPEWLAGDAQATLVKRAVVVPFPVVCRPLGVRPVVALAPVRERQTPHREDRDGGHKARQRSRQLPSPTEGELHMSLPSLCWRLLRPRSASALV